MGDSDLPIPEGRLYKLFSGFVESRLSDDESRELQRVLTQSKSARRLYYRYMDVHANLHSLAGESAPSAHALPTPARNARSNLRFAPLARFTATVAATACVTVACFLLYPHPQSDKRQSGQVLAVPQQMSAPTAILRRALHCKWSGAPLFEGERLLSHELALEQGLAELQFDTGVRVVMEGPASIRIESQDHVSFKRGKIVVHGGEADDDSLRLSTPQGDITDIGTVYSSAVLPDGTTEIHVFDGEVLVRGFDGRDLPLQAGEARRSTDQGWRAIAPAPDRFVFEVPDPENWRDDLLVCESFEYELGPLSQMNGGIGFDGEWLTPVHPKIEQSSESNIVAPSNVFSDVGNKGNALAIAGGRAIYRRLAEPIRMDRNGVYYLSFRLTRDQHPKPELIRRGSWGNVSFAREAGLSQAMQTDRPEWGSAGEHGPLFGAARYQRDRYCAVAWVDNLRGYGFPELFPGEPHLFVAKIIARADGADEAFLRVYSEHEKIDDAEPRIWNCVAPPESCDRTYDVLKVVGVDSRPYLFDEIRVGRTWKSVTSGL